MRQTGASYFNSNDQIEDENILETNEAPKANDLSEPFVKKLGMGKTITPSETPSLFSPNETRSFKMPDAPIFQMNSQSDLFIPAKHNEIYTSHTIQGPLITNSESTKSAHSFSDAMSKTFDSMMGKIRKGFMKLNKPVSGMPCEC